MTAQNAEPHTALAQGLKIIDDYVKTLPQKPGVYRMLGKNSDDVLYIGKAKNLKKRVHSYTQPQRLPNRLKRMISETKTMEFVVTRTEVEALLLEATLIKNLRPRYNILFKDSKFFAYILITNDEWPQLQKHRGAKTIPGKYFGPFASTDAVNQTMNSLHKIFKLRNCSNSYFAARKRPCLQYHIKRCTAPCVNYVSAQDYQTSVRQTIDFLEGKSQHLQKELSEKMQEASQLKEYERAIKFRDQIRALTQIQSYQSLSPTFTTDTDVIALAEQEGHWGIQVFYFRKGSPYGSRTFFPERTEMLSTNELLASFLTLFYEDRSPPQLILMSHPLEETILIEQALKQKHNAVVKILNPQRGEKKKFVERAMENAKEAIQRHLAESATQKTIFKTMMELFHLKQIPERLEIYDNSHIQGSNAVGGMVVASPKGFEKALYRKFNIKMTGEHKVTPGDDYGMMREVFSRRFAGTLAEKPENIMPDLILVDGGKGQLSTTLKVLDDLGVDIPVVAIAKGPQRNAGQETFYMRDTPPFTLERHRNVLYYLERLRDEAHRFAIGTHRVRREKQISTSPLDEIPGVGATRKKILLRHFGSARNIMDANVDDLAMVSGISRTLAQAIYDFFHPI